MQQNNIKNNNNKHQQNQNYNNQPVQLQNNKTTSQMTIKMISTSIEATTKMKMQEKQRKQTYNINHCNKQHRSKSQQKYIEYIERNN
jgi:hypothetical protein